MRYFFMGATWALGLIIVGFLIMQGITRTFEQYNLIQQLICN